MRDEERSFDRHTRTIKVITLEYEVEGNTYTSDLDEDDALFAEQHVGTADTTTIFPVYVDPQNPQKSWLRSLDVGFSLFPVFLSFAS